VWALMRQLDFHGQELKLIDVTDLLTEVFTERTGAVSIHWQAENPSLRWDGTGGEQRQFQCLFTGTAVG
jgi:hypothetical protein